MLLQRFDCLAEKVIGRNQERQRRQAARSGHSARLSHSDRASTGSRRIGDLALRCVRVEVTDRDWRRSVAAARIADMRVFRNSRLRRRALKMVGYVRFAPAGWFEDSGVAQVFSAGLLAGLIFFD